MSKSKQMQQGREASRVSWNQRRDARELAARLTTRDTCDQPLDVRELAEEIHYRGHWNVTDQQRDLAAGNIRYIERFDRRQVFRNGEWVNV